MRAINKLLYTLTNSLAKTAKYLLNQGVIFIFLISTYLVLAFNGTLYKLLNGYKVLDQSQMEVSFYAPLISLSSMSLALAAKKILIGFNLTTGFRRISKLDVTATTLMTTILSVSCYRIYPHLSLIPVVRHDAITLLIGMSCLFSAWVVRIKNSACIIQTGEGEKPILFFIHEKKAIYHDTFKKITNTIACCYAVTAFMLFGFMLFG